MAVGCPVAAPLACFICARLAALLVAPSSEASRFLAISSAAFLARRSRVFLLGWMPWKLRGRGRAWRGAA